MFYRKFVFLKTISVTMSASKENDSKSNLSIEMLCDDVLLELFSLLDAKSLKSASLVCKK